MFASRGFAKAKGFMFGSGLYLLFVVVLPAVAPSAAWLDAALIGLVAMVGVVPAIAVARREPKVGTGLVKGFLAGFGALLLLVLLLTLTPPAVAGAVVHVVLIGLCFLAGRTVYRRALQAPGHDAEAE